MESDNESQGQENQNCIELTKEFKKGRCQPCSIIELISLFKNDENKSLKLLNDNFVVKATKEYLNMFNKYGICENVTNKAYNIRRIFISKDDKFTSLEQTLIVDLVPSNVGEAFNLIPSLKKKNNLSLQEMEKYLEELNKEIVV